MDSPRPLLIVLAEPPEAFVELFGVSMVERLLRQVQRIGFREAIVLSTRPAEIAAHLAAPSWARAEISLTFHPRDPGPISNINVAGQERTLVVSSSFYYDARLLKTLAEQTTTTVLVDSAPPAESAALWQKRGLDFNGAALVVPGETPFDPLSEEMNHYDAADAPTYVPALRKHVRPVFFPASSAPELIPVAERYVRDVAQNGVLDFPGFLDSPIEDWIVKKLCRTSVRPNHVTFVTMVIGVCVTMLFATGHLWWGVALAYAIEVLDGVDGKLARTKVETTTAGEWEHEVDYTIELSWWTALAFHFHGAGLRSAYWLLALYVLSDLVDRLAKRAVKQKVGRNLDDVSNFDRFVRCIGARRNINIWILIAALALRDPVNGFVLFCYWGAATAFAHLIRALHIRWIERSVAR